MATTVDSLDQAWVFVMETVDEMGPDPRIEISPTWFYGNDGQEDGVRVFDVCVEGMVRHRINGNKDTE